MKRELTKCQMIERSIQKKYRKATILVGILCLLGSILTMYGTLYRL